MNFVRILRDYVNYGVRYFRLDAVFSLEGARHPCIHLPQTHETIKLLRLLWTRCITKRRDRDKRARSGKLVLLRNGNEAHLVYNFSLPPLLVNAMITGSCKHLTHWAMYMPPAPHTSILLPVTTGSV